ncbi:hypothetical protein GPECTOR_6g727 [Gonium pectorale]|uniref:Sulfotransferase n=1 Tax=Gonium pectorale TaxID=33097 RepID=A0A150GVD6_GONPE|nr:hypothetical protein GPECTOR_6g727 [Gonium pectorale]|eukprot:KXZ53809.1 hypothetical protein GPECTOR_6g727 [Gonium pectorale]
MAARSVLELLHISKAAGTSMCHLAEASRCRALDFGMGRTCLLREFDDQPRWLNASHHWGAIATTAKAHTGHPIAFMLYGVPRLASRVRTCAARLQFMRKRNLDFFANEYTVYNELVLGNLTKLSTPIRASTKAVKQRQRRRRRYLHGEDGQPHAQPRQQEEEQQEQEPQAKPAKRRTAKQSAAMRLQMELERERDLGVRAAAAAADYLGHVQRITAAGAEAHPQARLEEQPAPEELGDYSAVIRGTHLCPRFAAVAVLRDPLERFRSHLLFVLQTYMGMYERRSLADAFAPWRDSPAAWRAFAPPVMDNYMVRTLAGEGAYALPYGALAAPPYMDLAKAVLAQYDVLLVLESDSAAMGRACSWGLGWSSSLDDVSSRNTSAMLLRHGVRTMAAGGGGGEPGILGIAGEALQQLLPTPPVLAELEATAVQYDRVLYDYGRLLSALDDVVWRAANATLQEPMPGLWSGPPGSAAPCGYINMRR